MANSQKRKEEIIKNVFFNPKHAGSFGGVMTVYREVKKRDPTITLREVKDFLSGQNTYTLHKPLRKKFPRNKVVVQDVDKQWMADLADMTTHQKANDGFKYILTIIDVFSKYAWAYPLKTKTPRAVKEVFEKIFQERKPDAVQTDQGTEFNNKTFKKFLTDNNVSYFTSTNPTYKCSIVERFNRTLKTKMFKYFTSKQSRRYVDTLSDLVASYNKTYHRSIKMTPSEALAAPRDVVFKNLYGFRNFREYLKSQSMKKAKLKKGDFVRMAYTLGPLEKGFYPTWTDAVGNVSSIIKKPIPIYTLKDYLGNPIKRRFYGADLQRIKEPLYRVEKELKKRTRKGVKEVLVKFVGYSSRHNAWIPEKNLFPY